MKNRAKIILYIGTAVCILSILPFIACYNALPPKIPSQFSFDGSVSSYMDKPLFMIVVPALFIFINFYMYTRLKDDKKINVWNIVLPLLCAGLMVYTFIISI